MEILAFIPPGFSLQSHQDDKRITVKQFDLDKLSRKDLAADLDGIDAVVSALNGKALEAKPVIQDAAADTGVQRYYPSEYGIQSEYRKPGDPWGYIHPIWELKAQLIERAVLHPVIISGKMTFTIIGCGDFYNQDREKKFQKNQYLNFPSDTISHTEIATLLEKYSGKPVKKDIISEDEIHEVVKDPSRAPEEMSNSAFPVDFWFLFKGSQGQGRFLRPPGQNHNHLFPYIVPTTFEDYFKGRFG
ncbi:hypothetical protein S40293_02186 [Stachybotrys chartarum IBT 40293]|nr:hypothetical protein S40293_02186 [Stachybotrys chartarum IBT 40293]